LGALNQFRSESNGPAFPSQNHHPTQGKQPSVILSEAKGPRVSAASITTNLEEKENSVILSEASEYQRAALGRAESIQKQVEWTCISPQNHRQSQRKKRELSEHPKCT
jgi:hypothetical protein